MTAASAVSTASAKNSVESAEPLFAEIDPTGDLQSLRTRRGLICDFATLCFERMGQIYQSIYDSKKKKIDAKPLNFEHEWEEDNLDYVISVCARSKAILDHFNSKVKPSIVARRKEMDRAYGEERMIAFLARCDFSKDLDPADTGVFPYISRFWHHTSNAHGGNPYHPLTAKLIYPLVQIILGNDNVHLPQHSEGRAITCYDHGICIYSSTEKYAKWIGIAMQSLPFTWSHPVSKVIKKEESEHSDGKARITFLRADGDSILRDMVGTADAIFATMQFALCVERRLAMKDSVITVLKSEPNGGTVWNNLINLIMDYVPPPKSAIEIVEDDS